MKILTIQHAVPSQKVTNADILGTLRELSKDLVDTDHLDLLEKQIEDTLKTAGTQVRYKLGEDQKAIDLVLQASRNALQNARVLPEEVDFLIYTGVGRGWLEPAMANVIQCELKMPNATCFDMLDACASWLRGMQVAHSFLRNKTYRCGMIVNCECSLVRSFSSFGIRQVQDLQHQVAQFTIGEAATATVVRGEEGEDDWYFKFKSFGEHFGLCMIPLDNMADFLPTAADGRYQSSRFFSLSRELITTTIKKIVETFAADPALCHGSYDICFGHAASERASEILLKRLGIPQEIYYSIHSRYGNTVSASVPLAMSLALEDQRLRRGDRVLIVIGSAGISVGLASLTF